jgi:hypothetical protein
MKTVIKLKNSKRFFLLFLTLLVLIAYKIKIEGFSQSEQPVVQIVPIQDVPKAQGYETPQIDSNKTGEASLEPNRSVAQEREIDDWNRRQGLLPDINKLEEFKPLELEALKSIADNGDPAAIYELGERLLDSQGSQAAYEYLFDVAAKGYVNIYPLLAAARKAEYRNEDTPELKHQMALEVLSIYKMGSLRGLQLQSEVNADAFVKEDSIELTNEDFQKIEALNQELQQKLLIRQGELGLGGFEKIPESVLSAQQDAVMRLNLSKVY